MKKICIPRFDSKQLSCFTFKSKSSSIMKDYIALHGLVPKNELPHHLRERIPADEIWVRNNIYQNKSDMNKITIHESVELFCMVTLGMTYKPAHNIAEVADGKF